MLAPVLEVLVLECCDMWQRKTDGLQMLPKFGGFRSNDHRASKSGQSSLKAILCNLGFTNELLST